MTRISVWSTQDLKGNGKRIHPFREVERLGVDVNLYTLWPTIHDTRYMRHLRNDPKTPSYPVSETEESGPSSVLKIKGTFSGFPFRVVYIGSRDLFKSRVFVKSLVLSWGSNVIKSCTHVPIVLDYLFTLAIHLEAVRYRPTSKDSDYQEKDQDVVYSL